MITTVGIIGLGNVGSAIAELLSCNDRLKWVVSQSYQPNSHINYILKRNIKEIEELPDIIIIAVSDSMIANTARALAVHLQTRLNDIYIMHLSGALRVDILEPCTQYNAIPVAAHPFQTFFYSNPHNFDNIAWGVECAEKDRNAVADFIHSLKGKAVFLDENILINKALYHATAVSASNYLTASLKLSSLLADSIGINKSDFLIPIIERTVKNNLKYISHKDSLLPITGPVVREDIEIIERHIQSMKNEKKLIIPYCSFGLALLELLNENGNMSPETYRKLYDMFTTNL